MGLRALIEVVHPCVLCEGDLAVQTLWHDDQTGYEEWSKPESLPHTCEAWARLTSERARALHH